MGVYEQVFGVLAIQRIGKGWTSNCRCLAHSRDPLDFDSSWRLLSQAIISLLLERFGLDGSLFDPVLGDHVLRPLWCTAHCHQSLAGYHGGRSVA